MKKSVHESAEMTGAIPSGERTISRRSTRDGGRNGKDKGWSHARAHGRAMEINTWTKITRMRVINPLVGYLCT